MKVTFRQTFRQILQRRFQSIRLFPQLWMYEYGYQTVGGTVCTCIRFCTQTDMFPLPPVRVRSVSRGKFSPPHTLGKLYLCPKICISRTTAVKKAGIRSAHRKLRTKIFVRSRKKVHLFSFKGVVSSDSELFNSLKIQPIRKLKVHFINRTLSC